MKISTHKLIIYLIIAEFVAIFMAMLFAGPGHGSYAPARIIFPFTMLSTIFHENIRGVYILLGLIQFPAYGLIASSVKNTKMFKPTIGLLCIIHVVVVIIVFKFHNEYFPNTF